LATLLYAAAASSGEISWVEHGDGGGSEVRIRETLGQVSVLSIAKSSEGEEKALSQATNLTVLETIHGGAAVRGVIGHCYGCSRDVALVARIWLCSEREAAVAGGAAMTRFGE
jgi:hypothetical protein